MKISYAYRRMTYYPFQGSSSWELLPPKEARAGWLRKVRALGFEGIEISATQALEGGETGARELRRELEDAGVPCVAIRGGGGFAHPRQVAGSRQGWARSLRAAGLVGAGLVNSAIGSPVAHPRAAGAGDRGQPIKQVSSRLANEAQYEATARHLREAGRLAADLGIELSIEMHQNSVADSSWSCLYLLELIDLPNVGVNPDLGNLFWNYDIPEESCEAAIVALAPKAKYWHCKQLARLYLPHAQESFFRQVPLPDGEIDYRFAITAMVEAGYQGYLALEGCRDGDQLHKDGRSVAYCREILRELGQ